MCGPHIQLYLFTFRPIALKQLNSLTQIDTHNWLGSVVTHPLWVQKLPGSIPGSGRDFYVWYFILLLWCFTLCWKCVARKCGRDSRNTSHAFSVWSTQLHMYMTSSCGQGRSYSYAILLSVLGNVLPVPKMVLMTSTGEWVVTYNVLIALMCAFEMWLKVMNFSSIYNLLATSQTGLDILTGRSWNRKEIDCYVYLSKDTCIRHV